MALQEVLGGRRQEVGGVIVGGSRRAVVRAREVVLPWVHVWSARMSVRLQSVHFSAEKVVTMLQKRNQVFERVICAEFWPQCRPGGGIGVCWVFTDVPKLGRSQARFAFPFARRQRDAGRPARGPGRLVLYLSLYTCVRFVKEHTVTGTDFSPAGPFSS